MKAVILAGGLGTRISEETHLKPKPMIEIGGQPILWHILKIYAAHGQLYEPVDASLLLSYSESKDGQILEEGITEAGSLASFIAAARVSAADGRFAVTLGSAAKARAERSSAQSLTSVRGASTP